MNILHHEAIADNVSFTDDELIVRLKDARTIIVPLMWYPKLENATKEQLLNYRLIAGGRGIHWTDLDEDLSVNGFLKGISLSVA
ncbi:DUF2442 domain-containing protein [Caedibacter taeniospiralis]|jgi:hypothetical protein|uniref:DUF2442 domain-containing protein n=1 Tax=Caedibacter taeniospiralis TaxID=28907 RepID=UPI000C279560|nr:DUF2442 domain-containing protein [Caedibacter taeniospiralis]